MRLSARHHPLRIFAALAAFLIALAIVVGSGPAEAQASGGLAVRSSSVFRVEPENERVTVETTYTATNVKRDGNGRRFFFSALVVPVPIEAEGLSAVRSDGRQLRLQLDTDESEFFTLVDIAFGRDLFHLDSTTFTLSYVLPSGDPRDPDSSIRVNPAYAVFDAFGSGDDNAVAVRVEVPREFEVTIEGSDHVASIEGDHAIYEAVNIASPLDFYLFVVARNDDALAERIIELDDDQEVRVLYWPGDDEWADFVEHELREGFPALEELVSIPFPDDRLEIIESVDPSLQGYGGWYIQSEQRIEVSEDLDPSLMLHELSHGWFNSGMFDERWITEGLAEEFAVQIMAARGEALAQPRRPVASEPGALDLNRWLHAWPPDDERFDIEEFGYNASWYVLRQLWLEVGTDGLVAVIEAAENDRIAYRGEGPAETVDERIDDWRRFLDLLQEVAESETAPGLFERYVVTDSQERMLETRAKVRQDYFELDLQGREWAVPYAVRRDMGEWRFSDALESIDAARDVLTLRNAIDVRLTSLDLGLHPSQEEAYQDAADVEDLEVVAADLTAHLKAAEALVQARNGMDQDRSLLTRIGLLGTDLAEPFEEARVAFADGRAGQSEAVALEVGLLLAEAESSGRDRVVVAFGALVLAAALAAVARGSARRRSTRPPQDDSDVGSSLPPAEQWQPPTVGRAPMTASRRPPVDSEEPPREQERWEPPARRRVPTPE